MAIKSYIRYRDYSQFQSSNPGVEFNGADFDADFDRIKTFSDAVSAALADVRRDDGQLTNESVGLDQFKPEVLPFLNKSVTFRGDWVTATAYAVNDLISESSANYVCLVAHTSGTFATDLAAGKWQQLGGAVTPSGDNLFSGSNSFSGNNTFSGADSHSGAESHTGAEIHAGNETFDGNNTFTGDNTFSGSDTFTGSKDFTGAALVAATQAAGDSTTKVATTAFVAAAIGTGLVKTGFTQGFRGSTSQVPEGWVVERGRSIGDAASGATERANADCEALFKLLWPNTNYVLQDSAGSTVSRGADAATDWAGHRRLVLPNMTQKFRYSMNDGTSVGSSGGAAPSALSVTGTAEVSGSTSGPTAGTFSLGDLNGGGSNNFANNTHPHAFSGSGPISGQTSTPALPALRHRVVAREAMNGPFGDVQRLVHMRYSRLPPS